ncbi:MAG: hypothetical protein GQ531_10125 [Sulfurovum sp.]|nr:hypothetical protein [Sulfurovum sp.]
MKVLSFVLLCVSFLSAGDVSKGFFVDSWEIDKTTGPHNLKIREYNITVAPDTSALKEGWNYNKVDRKKVGLQVYISKKRTSIEYYDATGTKRSTAVYTDGKADGWFYKYDEKRKKDGLQHYFSKKYQSVELYDHGKKVQTWRYNDGNPDGWFYLYDENKKKDGTQKYVSKDYWSVENYRHGKKDGLSGSWNKSRKTGWHYQYKEGKKVGETYYK